MPPEWRPGDALLAMFLVGRVRRIGQPEATAR
jgi:hypothetical protein